MEIGPLPAVDPELVEPLERHQIWEGGQIDGTGLSPLGIWRLLRAQNLRAPWAADPFRGFGIRDIEIVGHRGRPLRLVVYSPDDGDVRGAIYFAHGGGMVAGSVGAADVDHVLGVARELSLVVIEVDYALAPEFPFPAGVEDVYAALQWVVAEAKPLGYPAGRLILAGFSGGGTVAIGAALLARDRGGAEAAGVLLETPMLDDRCDSIVHRQVGRLGLEEMWDAYLDGRRGTAGVSPVASPGRATDLAGLPPILIDAGSADQFRDEATAFASRIWAVGGRADLHIWDGCPHGVEVMAPDAGITRELLDVRRRWIMRLFDQIAPSRSRDTSTDSTAG